MTTTTTTTTTTPFTMAELDAIMERCRADEYTIFISYMGSYGRETKVRVSLEKGSTYGKMHMKFEAEAATVQEAFTKCLLNFPASPVGAVWDTKRLQHTPDKQPEVVDGEFTDTQTVYDPIPKPVPPQKPHILRDGYTQAELDDPNSNINKDDIPF